MSSSKRKAAEQKWNENVKAYLEYLCKLLPHIPRETRKAIMEITDGDTDLHDFRIEGINFFSAECDKGIKSERPPLFFKRNCRLQLTDNDIHVELIMSDIKKMNIDVEYRKESNAFDVRWGYCEFSYKKPKIVLSILCDSGHIWQFEFLSLAIVKTNAKKDRKDETL